MTTTLRLRGTSRVGHNVCGSTLWNQAVASGVLLCEDAHGRPPVLKWGSGLQQQHRGPGLTLRRCSKVPAPWRTLVRGSTGARPELWVQLPQAQHPRIPSDLRKGNSLPDAIHQGGAVSGVPNAHSTRQSGRAGHLGAQSPWGLPGEAPDLARCPAHSGGLARLLNQNPPTTALLLALTKPTNERSFVAQHGPGATSEPRREQQPPSARVS